MSQTHPSILVFIETSWGAIDWILPVIHRLRQHSASPIYVYFKNRRAFHHSEFFQDLDEILCGDTTEIMSAESLTAKLGWRKKLRLIVDYFRARLRDDKSLISSLLTFLVQLVLLPLPLGILRAARFPRSMQYSLLRDYLAERQVTHVLTDFTCADFHTTNNTQIREFFPAAKIVFFPHGTNSMAERQDDVAYSEEQPCLSTFDENMVLLAGRTTDIPFYRSYGVKCRINACGHPKLDPWWAAEFRQNKVVDETIDTDNTRPRVLFLSMPKAKAATPESFNFLVRGLFRIVSKRKLQLSVKLHPSQRAAEIQELLAEFPGIDVKWCRTSILSAACSADVVVSFPSSGVMDVIAAGTPVIEYYDFENQNYTSFITVDGKVTSIYRQQGLVVAIDDPQALASWFADAQEAPFLDRIVAAQYRRLGTILERQEGIVDTILDEFEPPAKAAAA